MYIKYHLILLTSLLTLLIFMLITSFYKKNTFIKKNNLINNFSNIFFILLIVFILRTFIYEPYFIPSASMMPTLLIGDFILVNKLSYNIKNPLNNKILFKINNPKYGDIIVFKYPKNNNIIYIKRIIGIPGDKIIYNTILKKIKIYKNNSINKKKYYTLKKIKYSKKKISSYIEQIIINKKKKLIEYFWNKNININNFNKNSKLIILFERNEIFNNIKHKILIIPNFYLKPKYIYKNKIKTWTIPKNMYFVMGDYRDNSKDSRYWGFLHKNLIIGKAEYIWMSIEKQENNWPTNIRLNRIGKIN